MSDTQPENQNGDAVEPQATDSADVAAVETVTDEPTSTEADATAEA